MFHFNVRVFAAAAALAATPALLAETQSNAAPEGEAANTAAPATEDAYGCRSWLTTPRRGGQVEGGAADGAPTQALREDQRCEVMVVTGTRLRNDPSLRVQVLTAEEITARGLATTEEILRAIPQNLPTVNAFNNTADLPTFLDVTLSPLDIGLSTANLRGLGSRNTLVLVNGRRVAGAAGVDGFFANVRNIPAAAIEQVEVLLDSGGAVYGSDAVGGVVNIILKRDYTGVGVTGRYEHSATGGHQNRLDANLGYSWANGNLTAIIARTERDPVSNHKAGFTTRDYRSRLGDSADYNFVGERHPRSALVSASAWGPFLILPPGNDGSNAQPGDFVATTDADFRDVVAAHAGGTAEDVSGTLSVSHTFFNRLTLNGSALWQESTDEQDTELTLRTMRVPASNAFNNFGQDVFVQYDAQREADAGLIKPTASTGVREHGRLLVGFEFAWNESMRAVVDHTYAVSDGFRRQYQFAPRSVVATELKNERLAEMLASSDPNVAPNFFGDGTAQTATIAEFYVPLLQDTDRAYLRMTTGYFTSGVFDAPGGRARIAVGGESRSEWIEDLDFSFEVASGIGVAKPTRDLNAMFIEASLPLVGAANARPGLRKLAFTAKARYDKYRTEGAVGQDPADPDNPTAGRATRFKKVTLDNVAPYFGIVYKPIGDVTVRVSHTEGFVVPRFRQMFQVTRIDQPFYTFDPLVGSFVPAHVVSGSNPDLQPELSTTFTTGFEWTPRQIDDLHMELYYSDVDIRDRIAGNRELGQLLPPEVYGNLPQFFTRAEDGTLVRATTTSVNIARRVSKAVDLRVSKAFPSAYGEFFVQVAYHRVLEQFDQPFEDGERISMVGKSIGIDRYRAMFNVGWTRGSTTVNAFVNHLPGYINNDHERTVNRDIPNASVSSWTTVDASVRHRFANGVTVQAGGRDLLGRDFPFMLTHTGRPWDSKRVNLRGRVLFVNLSYDFGIGGR